MISSPGNNPFVSARHQRDHNREKLPKGPGPQATGPAKCSSVEEPMNGVSMHRLFISSTICVCLIAFLLVTEVSCASTATPEQQTLATNRLQALMTETEAHPAPSRLLDFEKQNPRTQAAAISRFLRGYQAFQRNDFAGAIDAFAGREIYTDTGLGDYALYYWGQSLQKLGRNDDAYHTFDRLVKEHPESLFFSDARIQAAESLISKGSPKDAIKYVSMQAAANDPASLLVTAKAQEASGDQSGAIASYKKIYFEVPATNESDLAEAKLTGLGIDLNSPFEAVMSRAEKLYDGHYFGSAARAYEQVLKLYPEKIQNTDTFNLHYGVSLYSSSNYKDAVGILQAVPNHDAGTHAQALYYLASSYQHLRMSAQFAATVNQLVDQHPSYEWAPAALYNLGSYFEKGEGSPTAYYIRLLQKYPTAANADAASFYLAWKTHQGHSYKLASEELLKHVAEYPQSDNRSKAAFWAAFDAERSSSPETAAAIYQGIIARYEYSYYGFLARKHLADIMQSRPSLKPTVPAPDSALAKALNNLQLSPAPIETADGRSGSEIAQG